MQVLSSFQRTHTVTHTPARAHTHTHTSLQGNINIPELREKAEANAHNLAALMITYPSTHGAHSVPACCVFARAVCQHLCSVCWAHTRVHATIPYIHYIVVVIAVCDLYIARELYLRMAATPGCSMLGLPPPLPALTSPATPITPHT